MGKMRKIKEEMNRKTKKGIRVSIFDSSGMFVKSKRSQITLFIIIAIAIVAVLLIFLLPRIQTFVSGPVAPDFVKTCVEDSAKEALTTLAAQGGTLEPKNYIMYRGDKIEYLCYTNEYWKKCVMQKPFLKQDIEQELNSYIQPRAEACLQDLKTQLEQKGYSVSLGKSNTETALNPGSINVAVNAPLSITKQGTSSFKKFNVEIKSEMYELVMLSSSIANWEARFGDADSLTYMLYYPDTEVLKLKQDDGSTVYILTNRNTQEKLQIASRSLAIPQGYLGGEIK